MPTSIEWAANPDGSPGETWNPTRGCDKVSPGCKHCYAETFAERFRGVKGHPYEQGFDFRLVPDALDKPLRRKKPTTWFVNSMSDLFHKDTPNEYIAAVFGVAAACPQHRFIILTKRAERLPEWFAWIASSPVSAHPLGAARGARWYAWELFGRRGHVEAERACSPSWSGPMPDWKWPLPNVWIGVSVEDQENADKRILPLLRTPAAVRLLSCEPLLGPLQLQARFPGDATREGDSLVSRTLLRQPGSAPGIHWLIVGGESGSGARPFRLEWARSIVEQCRAAGVKIFCKQFGANPIGVNGERLTLRDKKGGDPSEWGNADWPREFPDA